MRRELRLCSVQMKRGALAVSNARHTYICAVKKGDKQVPQLVEKVRRYQAVVTGPRRRIRVVCFD